MKLVNLYEECLRAGYRSDDLVDVKNSVIDTDEWVLMRRGTKYTAGDVFFNSPDHWERLSGLLNCAVIACPGRYRRTL